MKVLLTGAGGQVGQSLALSLPTGVQLTALDKAQCDLTQTDQLRQVLRTVRPDAVINASAYTAVDRAEQEPAAAFAINAAGVEALAQAAAAVGARVVHLSTDYVFDGQANAPYLPEASKHPLSVYGESKSSGEDAVLAVSPEALVIRSAWVYSARRRNFLTVMLQKMTEQSTVGVVCDQISTPTSASCLARAIWDLISRETRGLHHFTNMGTGSWHDFATAIEEEARQRGLIPGCVVEPMTSAEYAAPARRPAYSVLDCKASWALIGEPRHWREALAKTISSLDR